MNAEGLKRVMHEFRMGRRSRTEMMLAWALWQESGARW